MKKIKKVLAMVFAFSMLVCVSVSALAYDYDHSGTLDGGYIMEWTRETFKLSEGDYVTIELDYQPVWSDVIVGLVDQDDSAVTETVTDGSGVVTLTAPSNGVYHIYLINPDGNSTITYSLYYTIYQNLRTN